MVSVSINIKTFISTQTGHQNVNVSNFYINSAMRGMTYFNLNAAPA
jgi:hypothetical protein